MTRRLSLDRRSGGVLLHLTSLPGPYGCGDLGPEARRFVDFLAAAGQTWWQMLPIGPPGPGNSPYSALSAFAGNHLLVSLDHLAERGLLSPADLARPPRLPPRSVVYAPTARYRHTRLRRAFQAFVHAGGLRNSAFLRFCHEQAHWLDDYALYAALRHSFQSQAWTEWSPALRLRRAKAIRRAARTLATELDFQRFVQFEFHEQWTHLKRYANQRGVGLIGDLPIFVAYDSSDVWANQELFDLDPAGRPRTVSGVPPDYFSRTGQLWGHPHYRWPGHRTSQFSWWRARFACVLSHFDVVRIDHFLGFYRVWAVPGRARTAQRGKWVRTPGRKLLEILHRMAGPGRIIAEDLGLVTRQAVALRDRFGLPGTRLLQFAFGAGPQSRYNQPHNYPHNCVVYPGTHDNETIRGWFNSLRAKAAKRPASGAARQLGRVLRYLGTGGEEIHWDLIRLALMSPANTAIIPMQDLLGLDNRARMNRPGTSRGNWRWRLMPGQLTEGLARQMRDWAEAYQRLP